MCEGSFMVLVSVFERAASKSTTEFPPCVCVCAP